MPGCSRARTAAGPPALAAVKCRRSAVAFSSCGRPATTMPGNIWRARAVWASRFATFFERPTPWAFHFTCSMLTWTVCWKAPRGVRSLQSSGIAGPQPK
eukprot:scaffold650_cov249-Pinguiococcus_pyrenoidosus.AAC.18